MADTPPRRRLAAALAAVLLASACTSTTPNQPPPEPAASSSATVTDAAPTATAPFGSQCPNLPDTGDGSLLDLSNRDWVDALARVPALSQLSVTTALSGLGRDLGGVQEATVFAPTDAAFRTLGLDRSRELLIDPAAAADVLRYHVVGQRLDPTELAGEHETLNGQTIEITGSGDDFTVNGNAKITCGGLQTKNATLYLIDHVLQPSQ